MNGATPVSLRRSPPTPDVIVYDLYLKSEAFMDRPTRQGFDRAVAYFQEALDRDPKFARALAMMGTAKLVSAEFGIQPLANLSAAEAAGRQAMRLDSTLAEAHKVLANVARLHRQFVESRTQSRTAIALDPSDATQTRTAEVVRRTYAALTDPSLRGRALAARRQLYPAPGAPHESVATLARVSPCLESSYYYALLGDLDTAFELANQCLDRMAPGATVDGLWRLWQTGLEGFRADARFLPLAERLGLTAYWRDFGPPDECTVNHGTLACD